MVQFSLKDAKKIAPYYNLDFPITTKLPSQADTYTAMRALANSDDLVTDALLIGKQLWSDDLTLGTEKLPASENELASTLTKNKLLRKKLGHYQSGMFYYAGEWYWGIDRLPYLEKRMKKIGLKKNNSSNISHFQENIKHLNQMDKKDLTVEFFISIKPNFEYLILI